ncbi:polyribonucleotide nucleotidyltransferase [Seleniivibrio woodruffii]|uniref:Polyribonucleotide nucleotidyltransferase n=1 Tax=Seleniivibrio woodruffii TaxID=1078050 RepID=A0A4V2PS07_9BACT|nr:polyribonucleotide nucleotidyltransferase [Seleniivibrio woodruffii]TCK60811.1 polyribonucleotide nucleotidyltransferase [Seleniivibrio woodruffii]TVZ36441.1 polyribonucleotide nucleotidyltransferase [Seleniivibrio woodruffii]
MDKNVQIFPIRLREDADEIIFETGWKAKQANGSIWVKQGGTIVLVTAVGQKKAAANQGFFPLTVNYFEKFYAAGKIPGGFFKREAKPSDKETLISRLIDRPLRPMFPDGFRNETQVIATVVSYDGVNSPDMLAMNAASAALMISDVPFNGPIAGVRVGRLDGQLLIDPPANRTDELDINIILAGTDDAIVMVEAGMNNVSEEEVVEALQFGHKHIRMLVAHQLEMVKALGKEKFAYETFAVPAEEIDEAMALIGEKIKAALVIPQKLEKYAAIDKLGEEFLVLMKEKVGEEVYKEKEGHYKNVYHEVEKKAFRDFTIDSKTRIDGRSYAEVRPIDIEHQLLPMAHGSALFTRGETQALVVATLGTKMDTQILDNIEGEGRKRFMLHYNFPPFCVGEVGFMRGPGRREIGHGALAERALSYILPHEDNFPYTMRIVSEVLESNGSSSMATVCGGCLSLMDAGVPIKAPVAGVAMGLIYEGKDRYAILSDIMGTEDHLGDMDFKVAGTKDGITALQMDIKIEGLSKELLETALDQAKAARLHILGKMVDVLPEPKEDLAPTAPRYLTMKINPEKIGMVIGPGGKMIKSIIEESGASIDIDDTGKINIFAVSKDAINIAQRRVNEIVAEVEDGAVYDATVKKIMEYGAFVELIPGIEALLHVSQYSNERINKIEDFLSVGDVVQVKVVGKDPNGRYKLSRKVLLSADKPAEEK